MIQRSEELENPPPYTRTRWNLRQTKISNNMPTTTDELENKLTNYKELYLLAKEELSEVKKNEENRLRMIREDLRAFEEKRREIISERERRDDTWGRFDVRRKEAEDFKFYYIEQVINHLKLLLGISPEDVCIINMADDQLERFEASQRTGRGGPVQQPYRYVFLDLSTDMPTMRHSEPVTREEYIDAVKKGIAKDLPTPQDIERMKRKLLDKTIDFVGRGW